MTSCRICQHPLNMSQYRILNGVQYKSCPNCSVADGQEHVFYQYPEAFGETPKRRTGRHPEGPQSYCVNCRGGCRGPHAGAIRCSTIG